jgi:hypothetical protein
VTGEERFVQGSGGRNSGIFSASCPDATGDLSIGTRDVHVATGAQFEDWRS